MNGRRQLSLLVLGEDGVGKSSLVSTYVSRHFAETVGPVLTRVFLPPENGCTVTLIDTRGGDETMKNSHSEMGCPFGHVDSIVLVFDASRVETFHRMNNLWLPLIEHFFGGDVPVVVAGNKVDAAEDKSEPHGAGPTPGQIVSLLKNFKFVRQLIKCSAKELFNVDKVFREAVSSVLYPIGPIFDLDRGKLTSAFERALTRTFRVFDVDKDGLLSDNELKAFQRKIWGVALTEQDIERWKTMISAGCLREEVMRDGKITLRGFLQIFDVLVAKENKCSVPWRVLSMMKYDDDLNLIPPDEFDTEPELKQEEIAYLEEGFRQYCSSGGMLSSKDIQSIFCVCDRPLPPWDKRRRGMFDGCHSFPRSAHQEVTPLGTPECSPPPSPTQSDLGLSGISITSSPLPSIGTTSGGTDSSPTASYKGGPMSLSSWLSHWHMVCAIAPTIAREELYQMGYVSRHWNLAQATARNDPPTTVKVLVLTDSLEEKGRACLIEQLLWRLHGSEVVRDGEERCFGTTCSSHEFEGRTTFLVVTCLDTITKPDEVTALAKVYDVVILPFDDSESFDVATQVEHGVLTDEVPRIFTSIGESHETAEEHCIRMDLEPPLIISTSSEGADELAILHLIKCVRNEREPVPLRLTPHGERKKRAKRKVIFLGGLVTAGIVVLGLSALNRRGSGQGGKSVLGILRRILPF